MPKKQEIQTFKIIGKASTVEYDKVIKSLIGDDESIIYEDRYVSASELEVLVKSAKAIVLPYEQITNSGSLIYALSCKAKVIIKNSELIEEFHAEYPNLKNVVLSYLSDEEFFACAEKISDVTGECYSEYLYATAIENIAPVYKKLIERSTP